MPKPAILITVVLLGVFLLPDSELQVTDRYGTALISPYWLAPFTFRVAISLSAALLLFTARRWARLFSDKEDLLAVVRADWRKLRSHDARALVLLIVVGLVVRIMLLSRPMSYDESITVVHFVRRGLANILTDYAVPNNHILHSLLVYATTGLLGVSEVTVRLPAMIAGMLCIPAAFWFALRLFGPGAALFSAGVTTAAPALIRYSTEARGYTLLCLLFLLVSITASILAEQRLKSAWTLFVILSALALYSIPIALYGLATVCLWLVFLRRRPIIREVLVAGLTSLVLAAVLYLPAFARSSLIGNRYFAPLSMSEFLARNAKELRLVGQCWSGGLPLGLMAIGVVVLLSLSDRRVRTLLLALLLGTGGLIVLRRLAPYDRTYHFLLPLVAAVAGFSVHRLFPKAARSWPWAVLILAGCGVWAGAALRSDGLDCCGSESIHTGDIRLASEHLAAKLRDGDAVVAHVDDGVVWPMRFYLGSSALSPCVVHQYDPDRQASQIFHYKRIFVIETPGLPDAIPDAIPIFPLIGASGRFKEIGTELRLKSFRIVLMENSAPAPIPARIRDRCGLDTPFG